MIIELRKYNKIRELLIENRTAGSQGYVSYQDGSWETFVTKAAVCMGEKEAWMQTGHRAYTIGLQVRIENRYTYKHCRAIIEVLACNKMEIDWKIKRVGTSGPRSTS